MSDKIRKYVLPNLPYLFVFWFFSKIGTAYRIAPGTDFGTKLMGMLDTFPKAFETYWPGFGGIDLLVGLAGAAGMYLLIQSKIRQAKKFRRDAEYGTARFGTKEDIKPFVDPKFQNNVILTGTEFLTMNTRPKIPANARNLNACVIGSSGSGKTRFWLTPQLLQAHSSYVVVDPKGGTLDQCGRFLQREKYRVRVFNSIDFSKSMHYNPLAYIKTESDVLKFVTALIANTKGDGKEGDEFWTKAETLLYCALVSYIVFEGPEEERNMNTLVEMINSMEVREDDETFKNAVDYMFDGLERRSPQHFAVRQYKKYKLASGKTAKSILISCGARLAPFDIPQLREIMSYDELELDRMGDRRTATFFCISDTDSTYNFLVALAFSQMFNLLCERADNAHGGRLPHHVRVLWDEAANTGQVPNLEKLVAVIRSREISLCLLYQQLAQCKAIYDKNAETILGNMDSVLFLGGREASTIKEISENWLGKATISMQTEGRSRGQSESYSQNTQRL
ncbi:VirD4-like conjugal transfer protein, CD1115 family, partial [Anaerotignum faecicola]